MPTWTMTVGASPVGDAARTSRGTRPTHCLPHASCPNVMLLWYIQSRRPFDSSLVAGV
jgi:hypothetical protein